MLKRYQAKIYDFNGNYKMTINPSYILNAISFSANINGGQGQLSMPTAYDWSFTGFGFGDMVKVWVQDENNPLKLIYTGNITRRKRRYANNQKTIDIVAIGLFAFMNRIFFKDGANYTFSKNQDPAQTIKDVVDYFNSVYPANWFGYSGVQNYGSSINIEFDHKKCREAIQEVQKSSDGFFFFVGPDGDFIYKQRDNTNIDHYFTLEKDVLDFNADENIETLVNNGRIKYSGGYEDVVDATSEATYGRIDGKLDTQAQDSGSAISIGDDYVEQNKDYKKETVLIVNSKYNIESIKPGDYVKIRNTEYELEGVQILKTQYSYDKLVCYLDKYTSLPSEISLINN